MSDLAPPSFFDERLAAHARAARLEGLPWLDRLRSIREDRSFASPNFIELAVSLSADLSVAAREREEWARLAVEAALHGGSPRIEELEPLAWAHLATASRVRDRFRASRYAFARCATLRHRFRNSLELAETCAQEAGYLCTVRELTDAARLIEEALRLASPHAGNEIIASYEIRAGMIASQARNWSLAIEMHLEALDRLDPAANPRLALIAGHNLVDSTIGIGRFDAAMCALLKLEDSYARFGNRKLLLCRDIMVASIAAGRGHWLEAETRFQSIRDGYIELDLTSQVAFVDLELAKLAVRTRQWAKAAHHASRAAGGFWEAGSPRQAAEARRLSYLARGECRGR